MRRHKPRISRFMAGAIGVLVIAIACYFVFGGSLPFQGTPFQLKGVFTTETELHIPSPVRVAGVEVGQVTSVMRIGGPTSQAAVVTMSIDPNGLPIHADATAKIRPRIFLEGNFYVDLRPGTPDSPVLDSGATLSVARTSGPVQLDRVLSALNSNSRTNLETLLRGYGGALEDPPIAAQDANQDPLVHGQTGGQSLDTALNYSVDAFRASAMVNQAVLGLQPNDLSGVVVRQRGRVPRPGVERQPALQLRLDVQCDDGGARGASGRACADDRPAAAVPRSDQYLRLGARRIVRADEGVRPALLPAIPQLGPAINAGIPWIAQASALATPQELGGLVRDLTPAIQNTGATIGETTQLLNQADLLSRCFDHNIIPTGNVVIADPPIGTGEPVYRELFQSAVGLASAAQNFDGNGRYIRANAGGGSTRITGPPVPSAGPVYGNAVFPLLGSRPAFAGSPPPINRSVACYKNSKPSLNRVSTGGGA